ncbi:MATE family efflux transporter [uncultured Intestinimonas sp.]|uniref:MATE family efflux transporter n=1 Tax=uncultured Intestinimonas sp. TaxID=1689265 RepID=UPI0025CBD3FE|nr:MATE family efflux transporter [uncultured Intestinimonas sp.]
MSVRKNEFAAYISLSILGMLGSSGTILADTFFVSNRLGADGLAALNLSIAVFGLINGLGMLFGIGGATRYTIFRSQGDGKGGDRVFTAALLSALVTGLCFLCAGLLCPETIARALGAEGALLPMCTAYLKTVLCFAPCFILNHLLMAFLRNDGNPRLAMCAMLAGSLANIALDYLFVYPLDMGIFGAALATGLSPVIGLVVSSLHLVTGRARFHLTGDGLSLRELGRNAGPGLSAFVNECSSGVVLVVFNLLLLRSAGSTGVAAYGIVANLALVVLAVFTGMAQGIQPLLSRAYGGGDRAETAALLRRGLALSGGVGLAVLAAALLAAPTLVSWFNSEGDPLLQSLAEEGLRLYFVGFLCVGYNYLTAAFLSATGRAGTACALSTFRGCVGITLTACLFAWCFGVTGIWLAFPAVELSTALLGLLVQRRRTADAPDGLYA